jgi:hypothetical protein
MQIRSSSLSKNSISKSKSKNFHHLQILLFSARLFSLCWAALWGTLAYQRPVLKGLKATSVKRGRKKQPPAEKGEKQTTDAKSQISIPFFRISSTFLADFLNKCFLTIILTC